MTHILRKNLAATIVITTLVGALGLSWLAIHQCRYLDEDIGFGSAYEFEVGMTKKEAYFKLALSYGRTGGSVVVAGAERQPVSLDSLAIESGATLRMFLAGDRWDVHVTKYAPDLIRLVFRDGVLVTIHRHRNWCA